jgi:hypothetical protein
VIQIPVPHLFLFYYISKLWFLNLSIVLFLITTYCDNDKNNNHIPEKEWVVLLVFIYTEPSCIRSQEDSYGPCLIINTNQYIIKLIIFNIHQTTFKNLKQWKSKWSNFLKTMYYQLMPQLYHKHTKSINKPHLSMKLE